jgi:transporter family protein
MDRLFSGWPFWAVMSAVFAAMTAVFAKIGVGGVNSNLATLIRTCVILVAGAVFVAATNSWQSPSELPRKTWLFLILSGLATGASWFCYFHALKLGDAARVAPVDKLSVVFVAVIATAFLGEKLSAPNWLGVALIAGGSILVALRV